MEQGYWIPTDERLWRWLIAQIGRTQKGSIMLEISDGKLRTIGCHGHRFIYSSDSLEDSSRDLA